MVTNVSNYFDLKDIFINELFGNVWLFILVGIVIITIMTMKSRMPYQLTILFNIIWLAIIFSEVELEIIWVFIVLVVGAIFYYNVSKTVEGR